MKRELALVALAAAIAAPASPATAAAGYGPHPAPVKLINADSGRHVRVHRGQRISVVLTADPAQHPDPTTWWHPIAEQGAALSVQPQTWMPARGVTMARFTAVARGEATLSSARAVCPSSPDRPTCHALQGWSVSIDVR